jgi:CHAT domain-containing protein/Tfp pilus assembly protein PilF
MPGESVATRSTQLFLWLWLAFVFPAFFAADIRAQANANQPPEKPPAPATLEPGKSIQQEISSGQRQSYQLQLSPGQYVKTIVAQRGVDVVVSLVGPDGKSIVDVDGDSRPVGQEVVELVADVAGVYQFKIEPKYKALPAGHYEIRVAELRAATERDNSLEEARRLYTQARQQFNIGKADAAIQLGEKALIIREKILGSDDLNVARSLFNLGLYCRNAGDVPKAEEYYLRALAIREKVLGPEHLDVALVLHNLAYLYYWDLHDYEKAKALYDRALAIKENTLGQNHPLVASTWLNMGLLQWKKKDYAGAETSFRKAMAVVEKNEGPENDFIAVCNHNLGIVYKESGDYANGEIYYRRALQMWEKLFGKEHPRVALALESLGILYRDKGDYLDAEPFLLRALDIEEKLDGANHPDVANTLVILARMYEAKGDLARAIEAQSRAAAIEEKNIALNLSIGSEREKLAFFSSMAKEGDRRLSLHVRSAPDDPKARDLALTMILQRKGRVLDALADTLVALRKRSSADDQALLDHLHDTTAKLASLVLDGPDGITVAEHQKKISVLQEQRETLEDEVSRRTFGLYQKTEPVTLDAVRNALPQNAALIEFTIYHPSDPRVANEHDGPTAPHYVAYVVSRQGEPQWKELGPTAQVDDAMNSLRQAMRDPERKDAQQLARAVDEKVMQPLRPLLGGATQLLISPDGELNLLPFAALVDERGKYLLERYSISYLTSGRDLLRLQLVRQSKSSPVVMADPEFGDPALIGAHAVANRAVGGGQVNGARIDYSRAFFGPLPGVNEEVRALRELLPTATFITRAQATKAALQSVVAPNILHIATHGFFQPASANSSATVNRSATDNPLLRSGLALAGANRNLDEGILTALEASSLNLWGTKLVVLSACDTGLGEIRNGEGVYGLRRALVLAGTESQLMSLWLVSDRSTRDLMINYYRELVKGQSRGEALRQAQLQLLQNKLRAHPFYWAGFLQTGEWGKL